MRNALILLTAVALLILVGGALNNGVVFDVDYVAGTARSVSLLWVAAVIAGLVFVVGLMAAYLARTAVFGQRRKLEAELQTTYERLREAESLAARPAPAPAPEADTVVAATDTATAEESTADEATVIAPGEEAATIVDSGEAVTVVAAADTDAGEADVEATEGVGSGEAGEATAVTMTGDVAVSRDVAEAPPAAGEDAQAGDAGDDPRRPPPESRPPPAASVVRGRYTGGMMHS